MLYDSLKHDVRCSLADWGDRIRVTEAENSPNKFKYYFTLGMHPSKIPSTLLSLHDIMDITSI
jgi:hypothetical protein